MERGLYRGIISEQAFEAIGQKETPAFVVRFTPTAKLNQDKTETTVAEQVTRDATMWLTEAAKEISQDQLQFLCGDDWGKVAGDLTKLDPSYPGFVDLKGRTAMFFNNGPNKRNPEYDDWSVFVPGKSGGKKKASDPAVAQKVSSLFAASAPPKPIPQDLHADVPF